MIVYYEVGMPAQEYALSLAINEFGSPIRSYNTPSLPRKRAYYGQSNHIRLMSDEGVSFVPVLCTCDLT
jgi:hypothetical protein